MQRDVKLVALSSLMFDRQNPRLAEFDLTVASTDQEVIKLLWQTMDVRELVMSIAASGFLSHEPLIVTEEHVVIEGNRRLAAVRLLSDVTLAKTVGARNVPTLTDEEVARLAYLPVLTDTRKGAWRYLGFKHVNGPARWSSYAKSKYIAEVHREYEVTLEDIARQIGDTHRTVQRLYRGLMVIEQAEREKVFDRANRWRSHFSFSHVYTGIQYPGISAFLGLVSETEEIPNPVPSDKIDHLRELCTWMYGDKEQQIEPTVRRQNPDLRRLDSVVANPESLAALRNGVLLESAFEMSRPSSSVFMETLVQAKRQLQKARGLVTTGYDGSEQIIRTAGTVAAIADDLYREMERRLDGYTRRRYTEE